MRSSPKTLLIIVFALSLAACGRSVPVSPMDTNTSVPVTVTPSRTPSPTNTVTPTMTSTRPTRQTPAFPSPMGHLPDLAKTTPLATPENLAKNFKLKSWTEQDSVHLVHLADQFAYENDEIEPLNSRFVFQLLQRPVNLSIAEALYRFPKAHDEDALLWRQTLANAIIGDGEMEVNKWLSSFIENLLNNEKVSLSELNHYLQPNGFVVADEIEARNLFDDGNLGRVIKIHVGDSFSLDGWILAVHALDQDRYQVTPISGQWSFDNGFVNLVNVGDENKNGVPEVVIEIGTQNGTFCDKDVNIYEWDGVQFQDLVQGHISLNDCGEPWEYGELDRNGIPIILVSTLASPGPGWEISKFEWDGRYYQLTGYVDPPYLIPWDLVIDSTSHSTEEASIREAILSEETKQWGNSFLDYLRFRLGVIFALQGRWEDSLRELQALIDNPRDATRDFFPALAREFLELYKDQPSIYRACSPMQDMYYRMLEPFRAEDGFLDYENFVKALGFVSDSLITICDSDEGFKSLVESISLESSNIPAKLQLNGVKLEYAAKRDLDLKGEEEWVVILDDGYYKDLWAIFKDKAGYKAERLVNLDGESLLSLKVLQPEGSSNPILFIHTTSTLYGFEIGSDFTISELVYDFYVKSLLFEVGDYSTFQVFYEAPMDENQWWIKSPWLGYRWASEENTFTSDLVEYMIFEENDPEGVIDLLKPILPLFNNWDVDWSHDGAKLYYLHGLAYELTGDEANAVQTYWTLWRKYPESPYAVMARYKLEPMP